MNRAFLKISSIPRISILFGVCSWSLLFVLLLILGLLWLFVASSDLALWIRLFKVLIPKNQTSKKGISQNLNDFSIENLASCKFKFNEELNIDSSMIIKIRKQLTNKFSLLEFPSSDPLLRVFTVASFWFASTFLLVVTVLCCLASPTFCWLNSCSRSDTDFRSELLSNFAGFFPALGEPSSGSLQVLLLRASPRPFRAPKKLSIHEMTPELFVEFIYSQKMNEQHTKYLLRNLPVFLELATTGRTLSGFFELVCAILLKILSIWRSLTVAKSLIELLKGNHVPIWSWTGQIKSEKVCSIWNALFEIFEISTKYSKVVVERATHLL